MLDRSETLGEWGAWGYQAASALTSAFEGLPPDIQSSMVAILRKPGKTVMARTCPIGEKPKYKSASQQHPQEPVAKDKQCF
eukprot:5683579-Amphidinium_carterae.1